MRVAVPLPDTLSPDEFQAALTGQLSRWRAIHEGVALWPVPALEIELTFCEEARVSVPDLAKRCFDIPLSPFVDAGLVQDKQQVWIRRVFYAPKDEYTCLIINLDPKRA